jgi:hypothetical protein
MDNPDDLLRRASQYRYIARTTTDAATLKALQELADAYEAEAAKAQADAGGGGNEDKVKHL